MRTCEYAVLVTDIVRSTERVSALGDARWRGRHAGLSIRLRGNGAETFS
jgi:hypothetical protein